MDIWKVQSVITHEGAYHVAEHHAGVLVKIPCFVCINQEGRLRIVKLPESATAPPFHGNLFQLPGPVILHLFWRGVWHIWL